MMILMAWKDVNTAKVHRLFYPQVPVIVTVERTARIGAMPAIWCMPLSFNPPLIGVSVAPEHETCKMILDTQAFAINWLEYSYAEQVGELGETSGREYVNKLSTVGLTTIKGSKTSQPLIQEASAALECRLRERVRTGTHELIVGEVAGAYATEDFGDYWDFSKYDPMFYAGTTSERVKDWVFMSCRGAVRRIPFKH
jgi:flavin reductase (DIM6/NTAB) family NADH-FMN oxidoreductase RutF